MTGSVVTMGTTPAVATPVTSGTSFVEGDNWGWGHHHHRRHGRCGRNHHGGGWGGWGGGGWGWGGHRRGHHGKICIVIRNHNRNINGPEHEHNRTW
ncbi:hypothetical protein [Nonomuraea sp. NPDC050643]|uniref:hypothetical protein n=1 Tax=Nonomuraea sp. NPDC050643 TaxID=3155660 RepID=UPI00340E99E8